MGEGTFLPNKSKIFISFICSPSSDPNTLWTLSNSICYIVSCLFHCLFFHWNENLALHLKAVIFNLSDGLRQAVFLSGAWQGEPRDWSHAKVKLKDHLRSCFPAYIISLAQLNSNKNSPKQFFWNPRKVQFEGTTLDCKFWREFLFIKVGPSVNSGILSGRDCVLYTLGTHWPHILREGARCCWEQWSRARACASVACDCQSAMGTRLE